VVEGASPIHRVQNSPIDPPCSPLAPSTNRSSPPPAGRRPVPLPPLRGGGENDVRRPPPGAPIDLTADASLPLKGSQGVPIPLAEGYAKLDALKPGLVSRFKFHHEHLTSSSSWVELSGQKDVLVLGIAASVSDTEIQIVPSVIAYPFISLLDPDRPSIVGDRWQWGLETFPSQIGEFAKIRDYDGPRSAKDLDLLRAVPEADVKQAFAEILREPTVPKDWGGERSDLFTAVEIGRRRVSAAFAFKGPAKFHAMTMADLGKNGDQIDRLFSEPADLMVLQHCHEITPPVRAMMRAYSTRMGQLKTFCIINGFDTLRILSAYEKCGLGGIYKRKTPSG
jgi:hypothetical protein